MNKKKALIISILVVSIISIFVFYIKNKNKPREFESDVAREEFIREFAKPQGDNLELNIDINAGGNASLIIDNIGELMRYNNVDLMFSADELMLDTIKTLPSLYRDTKELKDTELDDYFKENKETLVNLLGIEEVEHFKTFAKKVEFTKGEEIIKAAIDEKTLNKTGNIVIFSLNLTSKDGVVQKFDMEILELVKEGKTFGLVYWK